MENRITLGKTELIEATSSTSGQKLRQWGKHFGIWGRNFDIGAETSTSGAETSTSGQKLRHWGRNFDVVASLDVVANLNIVANLDIVAKYGQYFGPRAPAGQRRTLARALRAQ